MITRNVDIVMNLVQQRFITAHYTKKTSFNVDIDVLQINKVNKTEELRKVLDRRLASKGYKFTVIADNTILKYTFNM